MEIRASISTPAICSLLLTSFTALTPFHKNVAGDFWTSNSARNIRDLGYTYPELVNSPSNATLVASIKAQYSGPADVSVTSSTASKSDHTKRRDVALTTKELYLANVVLPIFGLDNGAGGGAPYNVLVFLGDVPEDAKDWQTSESFVGLASTLGAVGLQVDQKTSHKIDLSLALQKAISLGETTEGETKDYLRKNLHYRIGLVSGAFRHRKDPTDLACRAITKSSRKLKALKYRLLVRMLRLRSRTIPLIDGWEGSESMM